MKKNTPVTIIVHAPQTEDGRRKLAERVSELHADHIMETLTKLNCPQNQKLALLQAIIDAGKD